MKIRITESQAKRLNLIKEDMNPLVRFEGYCNGKVKEINHIFSNLMHISIGNLLYDEYDINKIDKKLNEMNDEFMKFSSEADNYVNHLDNGSDIKKDDITSKFNSKYNILHSLVMDLVKTNNEMRENNISNLFSDVKPIDITDKQNPA